MAGRLGDILIQQGAITEDDLVSALAAQKSMGDMLGEILLRRGLIDLEQLGAALEEQYEVPFLPIVPQAIHPQVARLLPEELARAHMAVPVAVEQGTMTLAMTSPDSIEAISEALLFASKAGAGPAKVREGTPGRLCVLKDPGGPRAAHGRQRLRPGRPLHDPTQGHASGP